MKISQLIKSSIHSHMDLFLNHFDPIKEVTVSKNRNLARPNSVTVTSVSNVFFPTSNLTYKKHLTLPLVVSYYFLLDTVFILAQGNFKLEHFKQSPHLLPHRMFPRKLWVQGEFVVFILLTIQTIVYTSLFIHPCMDEKYTMKLFQTDSKQPLALVDVDGKGIYYYDTVII